MITCPFLASVRFQSHLTANADRSTSAGDSPPPWRGILAAIPSVLTVAPWVAARQAVCSRNVGYMFCQGAGEVLGEVYMYLSLISTKKAKKRTTFQNIFFSNFPRRFRPR